MHGQAFDIGNFHGAPVPTIVLLAERVAAKLYSAADKAAARGRGLQECRAPHLRLAIIRAEHGISTLISSADTVSPRFSRT